MTDFNRDTWATPDWLFQLMDSTYRFDVDLCADESNSKCEFYFDEKENSLNQDWSRIRVDTMVYGQYRFNVGFCNPPYSNIKPWILKAIEETQKGFTTVMLIPTPNGESYYKDVFKYARKITFIHGRVAFYNPIEKKEVGGNTRGSCIVEFSPAKHSGEPLIVDSIDRDGSILLMKGI